MLNHPNIDPVAFSIGPLAVRWYGLMYLAGFVAGWWLGVRRIAKNQAPITRAQLDDLLFLVVLGVILALLFAARRHGVDWLRLTDFVAPLIPPGIAAGRLGNFINAELPGRLTELPWGMVFPGAGDAPRHPSQLYQFALEGVTLFVVLWWFSSKPRPRGQVSAMFLLGYGVLRFIAEFGREPDAFIGYLALGLTMGQWLCLAMIAGGAAPLAWNRR